MTVRHTVSFVLLAVCNLVAMVAPPVTASRAAAVSLVLGRSPPATPPATTRPLMEFARADSAWKVTKPEILTGPVDASTLQKDACNRYIVIFDVMARGVNASLASGYIQESLIPTVVPGSSENQLLEMSNEEREVDGRVFDSEVCDWEGAPSTYTYLKFRLVTVTSLAHEVAQIYANTTLAGDVASIPGVCAAVSELVRADVKPHPRCKGNKAPEVEVEVYPGEDSNAALPDEEASSTKFQASGKIRDSLAWIWGR